MASLLERPKCPVCKSGYSHGHCKETIKGCKWRVCGPCKTNKKVFRVFDAKGRSFTR